MQHQLGRIRFQNMAGPSTICMMVFSNRSQMHSVAAMCGLPHPYRKNIRNLFIPGSKRVLEEPSTKSCSNSKFPNERSRGLTSTSSSHASNSRRQSPEAEGQLNNIMCYAHHHWPRRHARSGKPKSDVLLRCTVSIHASC